ncbi:MAG: hypothetical protein ABW252_11585 [Polyangiales bacterium]
MARTPSRFAFLATAACALASLTLGASDAAAQNVAIDPFLPSPDQAGFTGFAASRTPGHLGADGTLWLDYGMRPFSRTTAPVTHRFDGTIAAQLGILSRGAVALRMPFLLVQRGDQAGLTKVGAGNPAIDGRVRVFGAPTRPDGSVRDGAALALRGVVHLPVGTSETWFADDKARTELSATADIELFGIGGGIAFGWRNRWDDGQPNDSAVAHVLRLSGGLRVPLPLFSRLMPGRVQEAALLEVDVGTPARDFFAAKKTPVEGRLSYRVIAGDLFGTLGVGAGLTQAVGAADFRLLFGVGWSPRQHDQDADGVPDRIDQCVHLPEDRDGFEDTDGCADDDNDGDLIVDEDDRCPLEPAEPGRDDDEDGCTDD